MGIGFLVSQLGGSVKEIDQGNVGDVSLPYNEKVGTNHVHTVDERNPANQLIW